MVMKIIMMMKIKIMKTIINMEKQNQPINITLARSMERVQERMEGSINERKRDNN